MTTAASLDIDNWTAEELQELFGIEHITDTQSIHEGIRRFMASLSINDTIEHSVKEAYRTFAASAKKKLGLMASSASTWDDSGEEDIGPEMKDYVATRPDQIYQGTVNPIERRILSKNVNIDTRFRPNYESTMSSDYLLSLPMKLTGVVSLSLAAIELPTTFYAFSDAFGTNCFQLLEGDQRVTIAIPDGNYSPTELTAMINLQIAALGKSNPLHNVVFELDMSCTGTSGSGRMHIFSANTTTLPAFTVDFETPCVTEEFCTRFPGHQRCEKPIATKLGWKMGFRRPRYADTHRYTSEGVVDVLGSRYLYLAIDDHVNNTSTTFEGIFEQSVLDKSILARISLQNAPYTYTSRDLSLVATERQYFGPVEIARMHIRLLDEYGQPVFLNSMDFSFCLNVQYVYSL